MSGDEHRVGYRVFLDRLGSPLFLFALGLLLLNDFILKSSHPGPVTGKLSDLAGLFAFGYFWCALWPGRKALVLAAVALLFVGWKTAAAQPAIDLWNAWGWPPVGRTVDPTDNLALPILLLVPPALARSRPVLSQRLVQVVILGVSLFAFVATSPPIQKIKYEDQAPDYEFASAKADFLAYLETAGFMKPGQAARSKGPWPERFEVRFESAQIWGGGSAKLDVAQVGEHTVIWVREVVLGHGLVSESLAEAEDRRPAATEIFEQNFVSVVREGLK